MSTWNDNQMYSDDPDMPLHLADFESHHYSAASSQIHPHPHPLFTRQDNINSSTNRSLDPHVLPPHHSLYHSSAPFTSAQHPPPQDSPHGWPAYDQHVSHPFPQQNTGPSSMHYGSNTYSVSSSFQQSRLSPPPLHPSLYFKGPHLGLGLAHNASSSFGGHRSTLAGSLDPATGIFYRTPEHPRLRTAQACEKCRTRKAKCSGEHPTCKRCSTRGLVCEYAKEGRVRGPNKPKPGKPTTTASSSSDYATGSRVSTTSTDPEGPGQPPPSHIRHRTSSTHSSSASGGSPVNVTTEPLNPTTIREALIRAGHIEVPGGTPPPQFPASYRAARRNSLSLSEHRASRPRPPDLHLETTSNLFRPTGEYGGETGTRRMPSNVDNAYPPVMPHSSQFQVLPRQQEQTRITFPHAMDDEDQMRSQYATFPRTQVMPQYQGPETYHSPSRFSGQIDHQSNSMSVYSSSSGQLQHGQINHSLVGSHQQVSDMPLDPGCLGNEEPMYALHDSYLPQHAPQHPIYHQQRQFATSSTRPEDDIDTVPTDDVSQMTMGHHGSLCTRSSRSGTSKIESVVYDARRAPGGYSQRCLLASRPSCPYGNQGVFLSEAGTPPLAEELEGNEEPAFPLRQDEPSYHSKAPKEYAELSETPPIHFGRDSDVVNATGPGHVHCDLVLNPPSCARFNPTPTVSTSACDNLNIEKDTVVVRERGGRSGCALETSHQRHAEPHYAM
ncbi:hypothetical protein CPC08DRAFT_748926 [Agrocybe pediades]|nr:hypothetical protein CPC08DRAFT_748926 [Agrocybe pediades]